MRAKTGRFYNVAIERKAINVAGETVKSIVRYLVIANTCAIAEAKAIRKAEEDGCICSVVSIGVANYAAVYVNEDFNGGLSSFYRVEIEQCPSASDTKVKLDSNGRRIGEKLYYLFEASTPEKARRVAETVLKRKFLGKASSNAVKTKIKKLCE